MAPLSPQSMVHGKRLGLQDFLEGKVRVAQDVIVYVEIDAQRGNFVQREVLDTHRSEIAIQPIQINR